jgi:hypothetical protein
MEVSDDVARRVAKILRATGNYDHDILAEHLDPANFSDKIYNIVNFYVFSSENPRLAVEEIKNVITNEIESLNCIEDVFLLKKDVLEIFDGTSIYS